MTLNRVTAVILRYFTEFGTVEANYVTIIKVIIIIIYRFLERHKSLGYRGAGGVSIRRTVGIGKS